MITTTEQDKGKLDVKTPEEAKADEALPVVMNNGDNAKASWSIGGDSLARNLRSYPIKEKQIFIECYRWCRQFSIQRKDFASAVGSSDSTIYKLMTGSYKNPHTGKPQPISAKLHAAMNLWLRQQRTKYKQVTDFVLIPTATKIFTTCDLVRESGTIGFVIGESHLGKTTAFEYYQNTNNHGRTCLARLGAASGIGGMLQIIGEAVGVPGKSNKREMINRISNALQDGDLIILDEFHELMLTYRKGSFFACAEIIREFYDRCQMAGKKVGFVLSITKVKWEVMAKEYFEDMKQILRRGPHRCMIGCKDDSPLPGDVEAILGFYGLEFPDPKFSVKLGNLTEIPYEMLRQLGRQEGLKAITVRLSYAQKFAKKDNRTDLTWEDFVKAHLTIAAQATQAPIWK